MAAYAALVSLMNNMDQIQNHPRLSISLDTKQIESLEEKAAFLLGYIESYSSHGGISKEEAEGLESQIASAAHAAEDVIESHIVDQVLASSKKRSPSFSLHLSRKIKEEESHLRKVMKAMDSIKKKIINVEKKGGLQDNQPTYSMPAASSSPFTPGKTTHVVGFESYLVQLLDWLSGQQSDRQILPITGMGGIGKTTLARNVYENPLTVQHFDVRAWVTISQKCNVREIFLETLSCLRETPRGKDEGVLGDQLHKSLSGRRYLIILDDMWSIKAWDRIKFFFPNNYNRSRIIVTTRISNVANHFGSLGLSMDLLDDDESWKLFCEKAFAQRGCPPELEGIGKRIVKKCKGLPLTIVVIGRLLGKSSRTQEYWKNFAQDISSVLNSGASDQCLNILSLSYTHLPAYLKPCFLYLGVFPEDHNIRVSRLIKLWVAEGFIKPNKDQSLEEVAEDYIKDLVDRNLVLVHSLKLSGELRTCYLHDLLRDLCSRIAKKENFLCFMSVFDTPRNIDKERRIVIHGRSAREGYHPLHALKSTPLVRTLICQRFQKSFKSRLARVLIEVYDNSLEDTFQQVNLRFLANEFNLDDLIQNWNRLYKLPSSISLLWNLQTLIIKRSELEVRAPPEIWEMPLLRHLMFDDIYLPAPPPTSDEQGGFILRHLQTLGRVKNFRCSDEVCKRMPNIKKLRIIFKEHRTSSHWCLQNVGRLNKLESLHYIFKKWSYGDLLQNLRFPTSLKKLDLINCGLRWKDLTIIGSLPYLEVLKLGLSYAQGLEWNPTEGEFLRLKYLEIWWVDLIYWNADSSHFPVLEKLLFYQLKKLDKIPSDIGDIPTLRDICLVNCGESAAISAVKILEEQESLENEGLQVRVKFGDKAEREEFRKQVELELEGFTSHNLQIY